MSRPLVWLAPLLLLFASLAHADDAPPPPKPIGVVTKQPKLLQAVSPEYPPAALAANKQAKVKVRLHIGADGVVAQVDILEPVGDGFDEAARAAALQYIFEPAEIDGKAAAIKVETAINFVIEQSTEPDPPPLPPPSKLRTGPPNHGGPIELPVTIEGTVVERGTRKKLAGIIVSIVELGLDVVTGNDGTFFFHGVPAGKYQVIAVDPKYDRLSRPIEIAKKEALEVRLWMRLKGGNPYETVVEGEREQVEVTRRSLQRQQLTSVPGTFGDPIRAITTMPGMQRAPFGLGLLLVRGSNPDDTGVYLDGHEVPALFHFLGGPSIFNAEMLESIDLYPGGFPARFGRHHGAAVALELRPSKTDGVHGSAKVDFFDSGGYVRAPITKDLTFAFAGRRSYIDAFLGAILPEPTGGGRRVVTPVYYDYAGRLDYNLHEDGNLSLFAIGSSDALKVIDERPDEEVSANLDTKVKFFRIIGSYTRPLGGDLKLTLSPSWGRDSLTFAGAQAEAAGPFTSISIVNSNLSYRMRVHGRVDKRVTLDTGIDVLSRSAKYEALIPVNEQLINPQGIDIPPSQVFRGSSMLGVGAYADVAIDASKRLKIVPSLRLDSYLLQGQERTNIDPRIIGRYKLRPTFTLKGYVGRFSQPPQPEGLDRRFGNPNLGLELAEHYGLGFEWKPDRLWKLDSEIYYADRHNLAVFTQERVMNPDGTFTSTRFNNEGVRDSYGLELHLKREISERAFGWLSYTFSRSRQRNHLDQEWTPSGFDQPHVLNAIMSYKPGGGWELGGRLQFASGRPDTPIIGSTFNADNGNYIPVRGPVRSIRVPDYVQVDVRAEKVWLYQTWSLGLYLDVINVFNLENVEATEWDYRFRHSAPVTGFPILPTLGLRGTW